MWLKFTKMQGAGNDFVVIDGVSRSLTLSPEKIRKLADRHMGIGCDQVLLIEPPAQPDMDFHYRIFNADGGEVEHCGNGARCFAKYVLDHKLCARNPIRVSTLAGPLELFATRNGLYSVQMGVPEFNPAAIPFVIDTASHLYTLDVDGEPCDLSVLSMGNPHAVIQVDDTETAPVEQLGAALQQHPAFPQRANIGFMQVLSAEQIRLRVFERGVGETLACGTGACAAVVAGIKLGLLNQKVKVYLPGGRLDIHWQGDGQSVRLSGPAKTVFHGQIRI